MRNVTIRQLQIFAEAAQRLSFARVAERLNLSPAAVSFQIKQIEALIGFSLFERVGKKVVLAEAGVGLLPYAKIILQALQDADQTMLALKGLTGGRVKMGLVSTAKYIVPHLLKRFQLGHPAIAINLVEGNRQQVLEALTRGQTDIAVIGQPPSDAPVFAEPFAPHPSVIIAAPSHPLVGRIDLSPKVLAGESFIVREQGSGTRSLMDRFFDTAGFAPRVTMTSSSNETIKQAVMAGMGLALISRHTVGLELGLGLLSTLAVQGFPLMRVWFVAHRQSMPLLPVHLRLRSFFVEQGKSIIADLDRNHDDIGARVDQRKANSRREIGSRGAAPQSAR